MRADWKEFLENRGAEFTDGKVLHYGNPEREKRVITTGDILVDLSHNGLLSARGEDCESFFQGQFTNDIKQVSDTQAQLSAYCNPKGRMLASFLIFHRADSYFLRMPRSLIEATQKRLQMFVLMSKVTLEDASESLVGIGYSGPNSEKELQSVIDTLPSEDFGSAQANGLTIIRLPGPLPRYEIYGTSESMQKLWSSLDVRAAPVGAQAWDLLDIMSGIPTIFPETVDAFVPQMTNLQLINGVNFKKGCYTGQEIVARMQYLGTLKRRMFLAHVDTDDQPSPGMALSSPHSSSGQGTGKVVNAQASPSGGYDLLAVAEISSVEKGDIHLGQDDGPLLEFKDLPYSFEEA
jgi:folate-binding protein YgfZ